VRDPVARHAADWAGERALAYSDGMKKGTSNTFARRARLSTLSIAVALALTVAAVVAVIAALGNGQLDSRTSAVSETKSAVTSR
jgi:hypothetical protein